MKNLTIVLVVIFFSSIYSQSLNWSTAIMLSDSIANNVNPSFVNINDYNGWVEYNYLLWERDYGDSSSIMMMKPCQPDTEIVIRTSTMNVQFKNPIGTFCLLNTIFIVWESNQTGNFDLYGGFYNNNHFTGLHQITSDSLDDTNPEILGNTLVWERNGNIIVSEFNIVDTALVWWEPELTIDRNGCSNPVISLDNIIAYEKIKNDTSAIYISWKTETTWHTPVCIYSKGDNRSLSFDKGDGLSLFWQSMDSLNGKLKRCTLWKQSFYDTITVIGTSSFDFSSKDETSPVSYFYPMITKEYTEVLSPLMAFESDSTKNTEIFVNERSFDPVYKNISNNINPDVSPKLSEAGVGESTGGDFRIWLVWQSQRNNKWQIWGSYNDFILQGIEPKESIQPKKLKLYQNYPNPFNSQTTISYYLPTLSGVIIEIYNILGQKIWESLIFDQAPGKHKIVWDGENGLGNSLPSGLYFYKITTQKFSQSKKLLILR